MKISQPTIPAWPRLGPALRAVGAAGAILLMAGCGGSGGGGSSSILSNPEPLITGFASSAGTIPMGGSANLTATFSNGTGVITPGNLPITSGGMVQVMPTVSTAYTLTVTGSDQSSVTQMTAVGVSPGAGTPAFSLIAGSTTQDGDVNGSALSAQFGNPNGIAADASGNIYLADGGQTGNGGFNNIRLVSSGMVSKLADVNEVWGLALDGSGNLYASCVDNTIREITPGGVVSVLAGTQGVAGSANGTGAAASFNRPTGIALGSQGNLYVADTGNNTIRMVTPAGVVTTLAGTAGVTGSANGTGPAASFNFPLGVAVDGSLDVYVSDAQNNTIRMITPAGVVTTLAGTAGVAGSADGSAASATFDFPVGLALDGAGNLFVVDSNNGNIRMISANGVVSTVFGAAGSAMTSYARQNLSCIAIDPATGSLDISFSSNNGAGILQSGPVAASVAPALSPDQMAFESLALAPNATYGLDWSLPDSGAPVVGTHYLLQDSFSMNASPLTGGPQTVTFSPLASLSATLGIPASQSSPNRYVINGQILVGSGPAWMVTIRYPGSAIQFDYLAADGATIVSSQSRSGFSLNPLSGTNSPAPLVTFYNVIFTNPALTSGSLSWLSGSAYVEYTDTQLNDVYLVYDYNGSTVGNSPNPVAIGTTIAALMGAGGIHSSSDGTTYTLADGTLSVINGVNTFVATNTRPNQLVTAYRTYYEINGNVYTGEVIKAGTVRAGSDTAQYHIGLNLPAEQTFQAGILF